MGTQIINGVFKSVSIVILILFTLSAKIICRVAGEFEMDRCVVGLQKL